MRAIGYLFLNIEPDQEILASKSALEKDISDFCQEEAHTLNKIFIDRIDDAKYTRGQLQNLIHLLEKQPGEYLVVVTNPSHLGNTTQEAIDMVLRIDELECPVISTSREHPDAIRTLFTALSTSGPTSTRIQQIKKALQAKAAKGEGLGKTPYGYHIDNNGKFAISPKEAELIKTDISSIHRTRSRLT